MPAKSFSSILESDPLRKKILNKLAGIKKGYYYSAEDFTKELGYRPSVLKNWYKRYPEIINHRCYVKQGQNRLCVFVHSQFKHQLIESGKATENY